MDKIVFEDGTGFVPGNIFGVGRNYMEHIKEMRSEKTNDPVLFVCPGEYGSNVETFAL